MLSSIFVDRPRLAIVIAIVTTIAGALALLTIPIAQYPDIVPPQVSVTTFYPGANSGVGDASLWGPQDYAMRAWINTDRLTGLNLTTGDIINAIQGQNVQAAVGRIGARPISDEQQLQLNIQTKGRLTSVAEFEKIVIRTNSDGSVLRLRHVAKFQLGAAHLVRETRLHGMPAAASTM